MLDNIVYKLLDVVGSAFGFFLRQGKIVAAICFAMSLGMGAIKCAMGSSDIMKEFSKQLLSVVTYFVVLWAFPIAMGQLQPLAAYLGTKSIAGTEREIRIENPSGGKNHAGFVDFLADIGGDVWVTRETYNVDKREIEKSISLSIIDPNTGVISVSKCFRLSIVTVKACWMSARPVIKGGIKNVASDTVNVMKAIPDVIFVLGIACAYMALTIMALVNYVMASIDYIFLYAVGIFFVPFMLWDGTKFVFEKLIGSMFNITVKMLIISMGIVIAQIVSIENLGTLYLISVGESTILQRLEFYFVMIFMAILIKTIVDHAQPISDFLCGGQPRLSFGEFAASAKSVSNAFTPAKQAAKGVAGATLGAAASIAGASSNAGGAMALQGGGMGAKLLAGGKAFGSTLMKNAGKGIDNIAGDVVSGGINSLKSFPSAISAQHPLTSEGVGARGPSGGDISGGGGENKNNAPQGLSGKLKNGLEKFDKMTEQKAAIGGNTSIAHNEGK